MSETERVTAALIIIGDEILSGRTTDKNINHIARKLVSTGIDLKEVRVIPDDEQRIIDTVNRFRNLYSYVFTTGGIGPTHDDITADSIAKAFEVPIDIDARAVAIAKQKYTPEQLKDEVLRMMRIPQGADLVLNRISHAPGFMLGNVIVMAGIPEIMQVMLEDVLPRLETSTPVSSLSIQIARVESDISKELRLIQEQYKQVLIGSYPYYEEGAVGTYIVCRSPDEALLEIVRKKIEEKLSSVN